MLLTHRDLFVLCTLRFHFLVKGPCHGLCCLCLPCAGLVEEVKDGCDLHLVVGQHWVKLSSGHVGVALANPPPISKAFLPSLASRACNLPRVQGSALRRTPSLLRCSNAAILKLLILRLNFCFESKVWWENGACPRTEEIRMENVIPFVHSVYVALWTWNSGELRRCRSSVTQSQSEYKVSTLFPWLTAQRSHTVPLN